MMFLESIRQNIVDKNAIPSSLKDDSPMSNEALSNLAFLDLSEDEKHTL
jgi:hypothetical protein